MVIVRYIKARLHDQSCPSKTWSEFWLTKFFDRVNLHQKLCQRTLMGFDGIETHTIFLKTLMGINQSIHLSNQDLLYINKST